MTRDDSIKVPPVDPLYTGIELGPIWPARHVPQETLLPRGNPHGILETCEEPCQDAVCSFFSRLAVLLVRRKVEKQIRLDERPIRLMTEDQFFVRMAADVFILKFLVEFGIDSQALFVLFRPDIVELRTAGLRAFLPFLWEAVDAKNFGRRVCLGPVGDEDMVLKVHGSKVCDVVAELFNSSAYLRSQCCGREDGESTRLESD